MFKRTFSLPIRIKTVIPLLLAVKLNYHHILKHASRIFEKANKALFTEKENNSITFKYILHSILEQTLK